MTGRVCDDRRRKNVRDRQLGDELCDARRIDRILAGRYMGSRSEVSWTLTLRRSACPNGGWPIATFRCDGERHDGEDDYSSRCDGNALLFCCHVPLFFGIASCQRATQNKYVGVLRSVVLGDTSRASCEHTDQLRAETALSGTRRSLLPPLVNARRTLHRRAFEAPRVSQNGYLLAEAAICFLVDDRPRGDMPAALA